MSRIALIYTVFQANYMYNTEESYFEHITISNGFRVANTLYVASTWKLP